MSIKIMTTVWEKSPQKGSALLLTLALADNANDDGYCFPGAEYLHKKIRMSLRQVVRLIALLERTGEIFRIPGNGRGRKTAYLVATAMPFRNIKKVLMDSFDMNEECAILSSFSIIAKGCHFVLKGDILSIKRVTFHALENGLIDQSLTTNFGNFLERQPSLEPSLEPSDSSAAKKRSRLEVENSAQKNDQAMPPSKKSGGQPEDSSAPRTVPALPGPIGPNGNNGLHGDYGTWSNFGQATPATQPPTAAPPTSAMSGNGTAAKLTSAPRSPTTKARADGAPDKSARPSVGKSDKAKAPASTYVQRATTLTSAKTDCIVRALAMELFNCPDDPRRIGLFEGRVKPLLFGHKNGKVVTGLLDYEFGGKANPDYQALADSVKGYAAWCLTKYPTVVTSEDKFIGEWAAYRTSQTDAPSGSGWVQVPHPDPDKAALGIKMTVQRPTVKQESQ